MIQKAGFEYKCRVQAGILFVQVNLFVHGGHYLNFQVSIFAFAVLQLEGKTFKINARLITELEYKPSQINLGAKLELFLHLRVMVPLSPA